MCQKPLSTLDALCNSRSHINYEILSPFYKEIKAQRSYANGQGHKAISIAPGLVTRHSTPKPPLWTSTIPPALYVSCK